MIERKDGNGLSTHQEQDNPELEPLIVEDGVTFYPFTKDMKLPSSEELREVFVKSLKSFRQTDFIFFYFRTFFKNCPV